MKKRYKDKQSPKPSCAAIEVDIRRNTRFIEVLRRIAEDRKRRGVNVPVKGHVECKTNKTDYSEWRKARYAEERIIVKHSRNVQLREEMSCDGKLKIDSKKQYVHFISVGMK